MNTVYSDAEKKERERQLRKEKRRKEDEIRSYNNNIALLEDKISRLKAVKKSIDDYRDEARTLKNKFKSMHKDFDKETDWIGNKRDKVQEIVEDELYNEYKKFYDYTDDIYDDLADEITALENKVYKNESAIGTLRAGINSIVNEIDKLFNW